MASLHYLPAGLQEIRGVLIEITDNHLSFTNPVRVQLDFRGFPIGTAIIEKAEPGLIATISLSASMDVAPLIPAIGFLSSWYYEDSLTKQAIIVAGDILVLSLSNSPNADDRIRPLSEQITEVHLNHK